MIKNIIFDMGRVLIEFDPDEFIRREGITDSAEAALLKERIFYSPLWRDMDRGLLDEDEMYEEIKEDLPQKLQATGERLIKKWHEPIIPVNGMAEFVRECRENGYGIYLLSNASVMQKTYWPRIPGSEYFDGGVVSAYEKVIKPDFRIYEILLNRYHLKAEECLFIDDVEENVAAAEEIGIHGYVFRNDLPELREYIRNLKER